MNIYTKYCPDCGEIYPAEQTRCKTNHGPRSALREAPMIGKKLGRYIPESLLGVGGMGVVYRARHEKLEDFVCAVKTIHPSRFDIVHLDENERESIAGENRARFRREARIVSSLKSDRIVNVFDFDAFKDGDSNEDLYYMAMELVQGETLADLLKREQIVPLLRALNIAIQIAEGLEVAHSHPDIIVHRDLKPGNVMIIAGENVKVLDFGLAKAVANPTDLTKLTRTDVVPGTRLYFSPEQAYFYLTPESERAEKDLDPRSDIHALGIILFQMLTGGFPYEWSGKSEYQLLYDRANKEPLPISRRLANGVTLRDELCDVVMRSLARNRDDRFPTVREFINSLRTFLPHQVDHDAPTPPHPKPVVNNFSAAQKAWELIEKSDDIGDFEDFLECFPDSEHAKLAAFHIRRLNRKTTDRNPVIVVPQTEVVPIKQEATGKVMRVAEGIVAGGIEMVFIEPGFFKRGSTEADEKLWKDKLAKYKGFGVDFSAERPQRDIHISEGFFIGKYQVTQEQWRAVVKATKKIKLDLNPAPSYFAGVNLPVESVSWDDCEEFLARLTALKDGYGYRFPTEAEWEYACRAGTKDDYAGVLDEMGWYVNNSGDKPIEAYQCWSDAKDWADYQDRFIMPNGNKPHPVGLKAPNAWGLYDMHGNVWEWCNDWYDEKAYGVGSASDPKGPDKGDYHVLRGGSWINVANNCRSACRDWNTPSERSFDDGLRLVMIPART